MGFSLPKRVQNSHKGTFGRVLNIAGSKYMSGAAYLSSVSALKIGCGYCFLASCKEVIRAVSAQTQNVVFLPFKDIKKQMENCDVVSVGCGLGTDWKAQRIFKTVLNNVPDIPVVIDADGLNMLAKSDFKRLPRKLILTPHPKEASRLLNTSVDKILKDMEYSAKEISKKYGCVTVLKSHNTVVCSKDFDIYINNTGNSALAKAGSGDVLTGIIAGLLAQGIDLFESAKLGVYLHGLCGKLVSEDLTEYSVMANDLINYIPCAVKTII